MCVEGIEKDTRAETKLHNEGLHDSPYVVKIMKSRQISCAGHLARMGEPKIIFHLGWKVRNKEIVWKTERTLEGISLILLV